MIKEIMKLFHAINIINSKSKMFKYIATGQETHLPLKTGEEVYLPSVKGLRATPQRLKHVIGVAFYRYLESILKERNKNCISYVLNFFLENLANLEELGDNYVVISIKPRWKLKLPFSTSKELLYALGSLREIFIGRVYGEPVEGNVIDVGAYIGDSTIYIAEKADKIYAIEPCEPYYTLLKENMKLNKLQDKVITIKAFVGHNGYSLSELVKYLDLNHVDLVKMDCEGCEHCIVDDITELSGRIARYAMECHKGKGDCQTIINTLKGSGYKVTITRETPTLMILRAIKMSSH